MLTLSLPRVARATVQPPSTGPTTSSSGTKTSLNAFLPGREVSADRAVGEWVVRAPKGTRLAVSARADRAGVVRAEVVLD
jgi:hypothetical protein